MARPQMNPELRAMSDVLGILENLTTRQRVRVMDWINAKIEDEEELGPDLNDVDGPEQLPLVVVDGQAAAS